MGKITKSYRKEMHRKMKFRKEIENRIENEKAAPMMICKYLNFKMRAKKRDTELYTLYRRLTDNVKVKQ